MRRTSMLVGVSLLTSLLSSYAELEGQTTAVSATGDTIGYMTYGGGSTTLLLVHGWNHSRLYWEPHIPALSTRYRVVTLDLGGSGESSSHREEWTVRSFADDVGAVLDQVEGSEVVLVGFSMGGTAVIEAAARDHEGVIGIILVDILHDPEWRPTDEEIYGAVSRTRRNWRNPASVRRMFSPEASETLVRRFLSRTPVTVPEFQWTALRNFFVWMREDLQTALLGLEVPVAMINSDEPPTNVEVWSEYSADFSVHVMEGVTHLGTIWERVGEFDEAVVSFVDDFRRLASR